MLEMQPVRDAKNRYQPPASNRARRRYSLKHCGRWRRAHSVTLSPSSPMAWRLLAGVCSRASAALNQRQRAPTDIAEFDDTHCRRRRSQAASPSRRTRSTNKNAHKSVICGRLEHWRSERPIFTPHPVSRGLKMPESQALRLPDGIMLPHPIAGINMGQSMGQHG